MSTEVTSASMATFSPNDIEALGVRAEAMVESLGTISAEPDQLVRLFLTPEHRRAADRVADWMREAGLEISEDALGTVRGRYRAAGEDVGQNSAKRLLIGSHIDTVIDAGMYDGPFGVIAGILAVWHFARAGRRLPFGIDVLAFGDEEGSRFPATLASSLACAGIFKPENLQLADRKLQVFRLEDPGAGQRRGERCGKTRAFFIAERQHVDAERQPTPGAREMPDCQNARDDAERAVIHAGIDHGIDVRTDQQPLG